MDAADAPTVRCPPEGFAVYTGPLTEAVMAFVRSKTTRTRWRGRDLLFEPLPGAVEQLHAAVPGLAWVGNRAPLERALSVREQASAAAEARLAPTPADDGGYPWRTRPYEHQRRAWHLMRGRPWFGLFMEMGTGKSKVILDEAAWLHLRDELDVLILVAPNLVHRKWVEQEAPAHLPREIGWLSSRWDVDRFRESGGFNAGAGRHLAVFAFNVETFSREGSKAEKRVEDILRHSDRSMLVIDESTRIKSPSAARTRAMTRLGRLATFRRILTGEPVTKGIEDLYSQLGFLSPDVLGCATYTAFKAKYCDVVVDKAVMAIAKAQDRELKHRAEKIVGYKAVDELIARMAPWTFRADKRDCLELPPKTYVRVEVPLSREQRGWYDTVRRQVLLELSGGELVDLTMAIVKLTRLQQIVAGHLHLRDEGETVERLECGRPGVVAGIVGEARGKVVVFAKHRLDVAYCVEAIRAGGFECATFTGDVPSDARAAELARFKSEPTCKALIMTTRTGGIGLDLTEASVMIYYSHDFDAEVRWQSEDRIHRIGQGEPCTYYDLVAPGTTDARVLAALQAKRSVADLIKDVGIADLLADAP